MSRPHLFVARDYDPALTLDDVMASAASAGGCFGLYRIEWLESLLSLSGTRMLCHFTAPDAESLRMALTITDGVTPDVWPGTVHQRLEDCRANVAVERRFSQPVELQEIQALEDAGQGCLDRHGLVFERTFFAADRRRMVCLYRAPDAESVRIAQREARMPVHAVWACQRLGPAEAPPG